MVYKTRNMASRRIAFTWLNATQGRLLRHLQIIRKLLKRALMKKIRCQQEKAVLLLQHIIRRQDSKKTLPPLESPLKE